MHVFEVAREGWTAFWDRGGADALFALRGWTEMAALRADLHLLPPASSASLLRLFLVARPPRFRRRCSSRDLQRLSFSYHAHVAGRRGEKIRFQHQHFRKFLQESSGWTEFNAFLAPSSVPLHFFLIAFPFPHNSPNSTNPLCFLLAVVQ